MKETDDEELQRLIEHQLKTGKATGTPGNDDELLYQAVFAALAQEPYSRSSSNLLADNVIAKLEEQQQKQEVFKSNLAIAAIAAVSLLLATIVILSFSPSVIQLIGSGLMINKWTIIFIVLAIALIQYLDKKLIHNKHSYSSH